MSTQNLGIVTAYGYAKEKGYTGTLDQFKQLMYDVSQSQGEINRLDGEITDLKEDFTDLPDYGYVPTAGQMMSDNVTVDTEPYSYRATPYGDREIVDAIVGGTVAFNQLIIKHVGEDASAIKNGVTLTRKTNGSIVLDGTASGTFWLTEVWTWYFECDFTDRVGHKVLFDMGAVFGSSGRQIGGANRGYSLGTGKSATIVECASGGVQSLQFNIIEGESFNNLVLKPQFTDLTQMFGTSVADAIYAMEQSTAGSGVAYLKAVAPKMFAQYNPYNAGELMSVSGLSAHETVGVNQWDEEWEVGGIDAQTGEPYADTNIIRSKNFIRVRPSTTYYIGSDSKIHEIFAYDADKGYMRNIINYVSNNGLMGIPDGCNYIKFRCKQAYGTTYNHDICINLSDPTRNGTYEPYVKHTYALDDSLTLMGVPKWVDGKLKFDGDVYGVDGSVGRRYCIVDLGTLNWVVGTTGVADRSRFNSSGVSSTIKIVTGGKVANVITVKYQTVNADYGWVNDVDKLLWVDQYGAVNIVDSAYSTPADFKTAMSGVYLVYEKATPTTETAEPYQQVQVCPNGGTEEYISTNIVPVGHSTRYPENSRMKLDGLPWDFSTLIAPTEKAYKATRNYTTGKLLIVNNILYEVTANIANGGNIVPNTNVTATTLSEVIASL